MKTFAFYISVFFIVLFICAVDSLSMAQFFEGAFISGVICYVWYRVMRNMSDDEISKLTGYVYLEKYFGKLSDEC